MSVAACLGSSAIAIDLMTATPLAPAVMADAAFFASMPPIAMIGLSVASTAFRMSWSPCVVRPG